jgi:hypothetical protein
MFSAHPRLRFARALTTLALGTVLLAGCASADRTEDAEASPSRSASPTPTTPSSEAPAPSTSTSDDASAQAVDLADPRSWVIDFATLGPLTRGTPVSEVGTSMDAFTLTVNDGCPWITEYDRPGSPSVWLVASPDSDVISEVVLRAAEAEPGAEALDAAAPSATGTSPSTREGIVLGSTLNQLTTAYPALQEIEGPPGEPSYAITDDAGNWIDFAVNDEGIVHAIVLRDKPGVPQEYCS